MSFGKRKSSHDPLPELKWDPNASQIYCEVRVREQDGSWWPERTVLDMNAFRVLIDLHNAEVGWIAYLKGKGRDVKLVQIHSGKDYGNPPSTEYKEGFRVVVSLEGVVHEMVSTNALLWDAFSALDDAYLASKDEHSDELPIVGISGTTEKLLSDQAKTILQTPIFAIHGWRPRPPELPRDGVPLFVPKKKQPTTNSSNAAFGRDDYQRPKPGPGITDDGIPF